MLEQIDLDKKLSKKDFKTEFPKVRDQLYQLQNDLWEARIPLLIVFEGWDAAGKGTAIERLVSRLDPRGFKVHRVKEPTPEESYRPFLWRFWTKTPERGRIAVFDRSWYGRVVVERVEKLVRKSQIDQSFEDIRNFERHLADDEAVIVKFWLHISKREQKKRFKAMEKSKYLAWKVEKEDWKRHRQYEEYLTVVEETLAKTSTSYAPWTVVEATDENWAHMKIFKTILEAGLQGLDRKKRREAGQKVKTKVETQEITRHVPPTLLDKVDLTLKLPQKKYLNELEKFAIRFRNLEFELYKHRVPMVVVYEGWDASGKGGNIKRLTSHLDPRGYEVTPIASPSAVEKAHHFLWRFWNQIPKAGHISIFDRSWYGRVTVERVEGFCTEDEWRRAYQEIREFEAHLANYGAVIVKFWIHISKQEQLRRFKERQKNKLKQFKITDDDWRNRKKWALYEEAVLDMLENTSTLFAPWTVIEGEDKYWARVKTLRTACEAVERRLGGSSKP
jgi:polyphosphate:AMP phosphotransferase